MTLLSSVLGIFLTFLVGCEKIPVDEQTEIVLKGKIISIAEKNHIPTLSVFIKSGGITLDFQYKDKDKNIKSISHYGIASTTKFLSAILTLKQIENNKLNLNDKIGKYLDSKDYLGLSWFDSITIKNLLNHTSGISDYTKNPNWINAVMTSNPPSTYIDKIKLINFTDSTYQFGKFTYSNSNYVLLEKIIDKVNSNNGQQIFDDLYNELNMRMISFSTIGSNQAFFAQQKNQTSNITSWKENYGFEGGAYANKEGLSRVLERLFIKKDIVNQASLDSMQTWTDMKELQINYGFATMTNYGLGLMKYEFKGREFIGHAGSSLKYQSFAFIEPTTGSEIILLTNCSGKYYNNVFFIDILGEIVNGLK